MGRGRQPVRSPRGRCCAPGPRGVGYVPGMRPWVTLGEAFVPGGDAPLVLQRRGDEYVVRRGAVVLMGSGMHASEERLAEGACAEVATRSRPRVLVGGLGLGYTLAAALRALPTEAEVVVAELLEPVVEWNRGPLGPLAGHPLDDPRVTVRVADVLEVMAEGSGYDAVLLDVDNGPDGFTRADNAAIYSEAGLKRARSMLRPGGLLAVWSVAPDERFARRFAAAGYAVREEHVRARPGKGARHVLWFGTRR